eukprot:1094276-Pyramimonas_sp.AAC.1
MDLALRSLQATAPWPPLLSVARCPDRHCIADCRVSSDIVELLGRQLDRCGPEQLTCAAYPSCPILQCSEEPFAWGALCWGFVLGVLVAVVSGLTLWR